MDECIFCKIVKGEIPCEKIYEDESFLAFSDVNPIREGHTLVIAKEHFETILDLPDSLAEGLLKCIKSTSLKLMEKHNADGFNFINNNFEVAQQIVKHVHFHIVPRKKDDGEFKFVRK